MNYAIIGSGAIGTAIARQFARIETSVLVANSRGPETVAALAAELGSDIIPAEVADAVKADMVILAVPYEAAFDVLDAGGDWTGRIVVDATNALDYSDFSPLDLGGRPSIEILAEVAPGAHFVKGFNHNWARVLGREPTDHHGGSRVLFVSGNDSNSKAAVIALMAKMGFAPIDLGRTDGGGLLSQFGGPLTTRSLISQAQGGASAPEMDLLNP
jgi:predicted dinucleotide-binding enzyme